MINRNNNKKAEHSDDSSFYVEEKNDDAKLDFKGLFSYPFTNVQPLCSSDSGPAELHTATRYGRRYILKGLKEEFRNDPVHNLALVKEFEIGIALEHPHIRRTVGLETVDGLGQVIVLEYIDGSALKTLIDSGQLELLSARALVAQVAQAVGYMHQKQIFHRDLKPTNILVTKSNSAVKIIDFSLSDSDDSIVLKNPAGSKKYMAPEQLSRQCPPSSVTDIYSLGVIMAEIAAVTNDVELADTAKKCVNPNPAKRPKNMAEIKLPSSAPSVAGKFSRFLSSKILTYFLLAILTMLASYLTYLIIKY